MYDIRQFRPALYLLLLLGISGYALAAQTPVMWVVSVSAIVLHIWLTRTGRFRPLPRVLANILTILAMLYVARELQFREDAMLMTGEFLVLLHLIKLFELRANRDYAQLLVLSLLLMVAAAINKSDSMALGLLFLVYLFLSLYCCLLFHLKVETDLAKIAQTLGPEKLSAATLRQDQRYLPRSMRRMTWAVSFAAIVSAVLVFLAFPRGSGAGMFGRVPFKESQHLVGMTDQLAYEDVAKITQNPEMVAYVQVWKGSQIFHGPEPLLLRMLVYDFYDRAHRQWSPIGGPFDDTHVLEPDDVWYYGPHPGAVMRDFETRGDLYTQHVQMQPTGVRAIGAIAGVVSFKAKREIKMQYRFRDETLGAEEDLRSPLEYEVVSRGELSRPPGSSLAELLDLAFVSRPPIEIDNLWQRAYSRQMIRGERRDFGEGRPRDLGETKMRDPAEIQFRQAIARYTLQPEVAGKVIDDFARGKYLPQRDIADDVADAIQNHLKTQFTYTLDLTDASKIRDDEDPILKFLTDFKRGHCEYFAGAMALMCQSVGIRARVVTGFKCDEYNAMGDYYIVRQSHAHAWVEVLTRDGWKTYDPTSGREAPVSTTKSMMTGVSHFLDFLQFKWAEAIVTYDNNTRNNLIGSLNDTLSSLFNRSAVWLAEMENWLHRPNEDSGGHSHRFASIIDGLVGVIALAMIGAIAWYLMERRRLRQRAAMLGVDGLPGTDQRRILRQLGFYEDFTRSLARHGIVRRPNQTQLEFVRSLTFLPPEAFDAADRVTRIFYRIRFGQAELDAGRQRRVGNVVSAIAEAMDRLRLRPD